MSVNKTITVEFLVQELNRIRTLYNDLLQRETLTEREVYLLSEYESYKDALEVVVEQLLLYKG